MKILIVNRFMGIYGGAETVIKEFASCLNTRGIRNLVVTLNISEEVKRLCAGIDIKVPERYFPYAYRSTGLISSLGIIREIVALRALVKKYYSDFDVINVHNFPANWVAWGLRKPVVWMCNEAPDFYNNPNLSFFLRALRRIGLACDKFIVNHSIDTICVADELNAHRVKIRYGRESTIIPYGIDHENFVKNDLDVSKIRKEFGIPEECFVLLQVGVISPQKNQLESLKALNVLVGQKINARLLLVGDGGASYKNVLNEYICRNNLSDSVIFTGHFSRSRTMELYMMADLCLFPVKDQGGWLAPFEALSLGKPVIVSETMGASCLIKKHNLGIVESDFSSAVLDFMHNRNKWENIAAGASIWVKSNLTWKRFTSQLEEVCRHSIRRL
ncbi:MAG: glycosyltransferase family 4 protein [Candidatus Omnitrophota bacterium]